MSRSGIYQQLTSFPLNLVICTTLLLLCTTTSSYSVITSPKLKTINTYDRPQAGEEYKCPKLPSPGTSENTSFNCDPSVKFWSEFQLGGDTEDNSSPAAANLRRVLSTVSKHLDPTKKNSPAAISYWTSQLMRTGYFTTNAILGVITHNVNQRLVSSSSSVDEKKRPTSFSRGAVKSDVISRLLLEAVLVYEQDWESISGRDDLSPPWDAVLKPGRLTPSFHRQSSPFGALSRTVDLVRESVSVLNRRDRGATPGVWLSPSANKLYPDYYLNDFHYQTDGWLSSRSAERYEVSTETLFLGRQDAMQRRALVALKRFLLRNDKERNPERVLEVACGTGRFATFFREEFPDVDDLTLVDLSLFYLESARENDAYWRQRKGGTVTTAPTFVQANAEELPFEDESYDVVFCTYLFHELPDEARVRSAREMARVVKKGGIVVFTDSNQLGDRPVLDRNMGNFEKMNEPYYKSYIETDLVTLFEQFGLVCEDKMMASVSKTLSFVKPD